MDRQAWIAVTLCVLGFVGWQYYMTSYAPRLAPAPAAASSPSTPALEAPSAIPAAPGTPVAQPAATGVPPPVEADPATAFEEKIETPMITASAPPPIMLPIAPMHRSIMPIT